MIINKMLTLQMISRRIAPLTGHQFHTSIKLVTSSSSNTPDSSDSSGSDTDSELKKSESKQIPEIQNEENPNELSSLINELNKKQASKINVAIPKKPPRVIKKKEPVVTEESKFDEKFLNAAKDVAKKIGGDAQRTEMELLDRLLKSSKNDSAESQPERTSDILKGMKTELKTPQVDQRDKRGERARKISQKIDNIRVQFKEPKPEEMQRSPSIMQQLLKQTDGMKSSEQSEPVEEKKAESYEKGPSTLRHLLRRTERMKSFEKFETVEERKTETYEKGPSTLRHLVRETERMKLMEKSETVEERKTEIYEKGPSTLYYLLRETERIKSSEQSEPVEERKIEIYERGPSTLRNLLNKIEGVRERHRGQGGWETRLSSSTNSFGILVEKPAGEPQVQELSTWAELEDRSLKLLHFQPPRNYFQEMIQWTEQGKIWHFPINNEQGLEEEEKVHFSEHVFLERHLRGWCPRQGPIRQFMELVCLGLSKNAFMTVDEKIGHIMWYKDYFGDKREMLQDLGAIDDVQNPKILPKPTKPIDLGPHV